MSSIQSITQSSHHALAGLNRALGHVDDVARTVATGIGMSPGDGGNFSDQFAALAQMSEISLEARANMRVLIAIEDLDAELLSQPRR